MELNELTRERLTDDRTYQQVKDIAEGHARAGRTPDIDQLRYIKLAEYEQAEEEKAVKSGSAYLVIVAEDASDNTKKEFFNMCNFYHVPVCCYGTKEQLGHAMGKEMRASLAVTDEGFSKCPPA